MWREIPGMRREVTAERLEQAGIVAMPLPESDPEDQIGIYKLYRELGGMVIDEYEEIIAEKLEKQTSAGSDK